MGQRIAAWLAALWLAAAGLVGGCEGPERGGLEVGDFQHATTETPDTAEAPEPPVEVRKQDEPAGREATTPGGASTAVEVPPSPARRGERSVHPENPAHPEPREEDDAGGPQQPTEESRDADEQRGAAAGPAGARGGSTTGNPGSTNGSGDPGASGLVVDAMVGQVNGKPIYAGEIFREIGIEQIERLGRTHPRDRFRFEMMELIASDLRARITNALILREAERELSEREREGLRHHMRRERENLLARWGGVLAHAEEGVRRQTGRTLEEELEGLRQAVLVERYKHEKLFPRINVTRRDVERYYHDNYERFNSAPTATVRVIVVREAAAADAVDAALAEGDPFEAVAERYSDVRAARGGLMPTFEISDDALAWPELNEAVRGLEPGEHSGRLAIGPGYGWVMLEELDGGSSRTLEQAYLEIEEHLNAQRFNRLMRQYIEDLMASGSYTPIEQMADALLEVAMARFARPRGE